VETDSLLQLRAASVSYRIA